MDKEAKISFIDVKLKGFFFKSLLLRAEIKFPYFFQSYLTDVILRKILPEGARRGEPILNLSGLKTIDRGDTVEQSLLDIEGALAVGSGNFSSEGAGSFKPFVLRINTKFAFYPSASSIMHKPLERRDGLPRWLKIEELGRVFPLLIDRVSLGLAYFMPSGSIFTGAVSEIGDTFELVLTKERLSINGVGRIKKKGVGNIKWWESIKQLSEVLRQGLKLPLEERVLEVLKKKASGLV